MEFVSEFDLNEIKKIQFDFQRIKDIHYLDNAGTTLYPESLINLISDDLVKNVYCNPHTSKTTENIIDQVRYRILKFFNTNSSEYTVIFTSGTTASLKLIAECFDFGIHGCFQHLADSHTSVLGMREIVQTKNIKHLLKHELLNLQGSPINENGNNLLVFPAQCNFNGFKYPLSLIETFQNPSKTNNFVCLDAASFASTNFLDLQKYLPDYVCLSFYKIFGYPTGLGALLVRKRGEIALKKQYYGGGTVMIALTRENWHQKRTSLQERFEDGTIPFLSIISLNHSFDYMENFCAGGNGIERISKHTYNLGRYLVVQLMSLKHVNGNPLVIFYHDSDYKDPNFQSGIVNFNILHSDGNFVGFAEFSCIATLNNIYLRTGCFCNPGACQSHLGLTNENLMAHFKAGHICGDANDLVDGVPTGSIRVSFGLMTIKENVDKLISVIKKCYLNAANNNLKTNEIKANYKLNAKDLQLNKKKSILSEICIYPIKSCGAMKIRSKWQLTKKGLKYDREWMIVNSRNGTAVTQKNETKLCLISPIIDEDKNVMILKFPYIKNIEVCLQNQNSLLTSTSLCTSKVCGDRIEGYDCGDQIALWLSDALNIEGLRLIRQSDDSKRTLKSVNLDILPEMSLSNQAQFLLLNRESVRWLTDKVEDWGNIEMQNEHNFEKIVDRFRGNIIVEGADCLAENSWSTLEIGEVTFTVQGFCTRCQMICIDQHSGEKTTEPLRTIAQIFKGKMRFGIYLKLDTVVEGQFLSCGDIINFL